MGQIMKVDAYTEWSKKSDTQVLILR